jgi:hypothetical protein
MLNELKLNKFDQFYSENLSQVKTIQAFFADCQFVDIS